MGRTNLTWRQWEMAKTLQGTDFYPHTASGSTSKRKRVDSLPDIILTDLGLIRQAPRPLAPPQPRPKAMKKHPSSSTAVVRRSLRIRNTATSSRNQNSQQGAVAAGETESESDKEDEPPLLDDNVEEQGNPGEKALNEKEDHAVIQNNATPSENQNMQLVYKTTPETDSDAHKDNEPPLLDDKVEEPANQGVKTLEEKVDHAVRLLERMSSKADNRSSESSEMNYRSLYLESQKKNEALTKENHELALKLEAARGTNLGYERGNHASVEWMEKIKDVIMVSSLAKASEMVVQEKPSPSKRKK